MKEKKNVLVPILIIAGLLLLAAAIGLFLSGLLDDNETQNVTESLQSKAEEILEPSPEPIQPSREPIASREEEEPKEAEVIPEVELVENPYGASFLENSDMAAWIVVDGTPIDYPVMWTPADEDYYLNRGFNKKDNKNGCLILDTDSSVNPLSTNLIIHGHNMKSGAMFGTLSKYADEEYYKEHKYMTLYTEQAMKQYEVIAVFKSQVYKKSDQVFKYYKFFNAGTEEEFLDFYDNIRELSLYDTGVTASFGDRFLTLSTCAYHVENGRFVVVAKEIGEGDHYLPIQE